MRTDSREISAAKTVLCALNDTYRLICGPIPAECTQCTNLTTSDLHGLEFLDCCNVLLLLLVQLSPMFRLLALLQRRRPLLLLLLELQTQ